MWNCFSRREYSLLRRMHCVTFFPNAIQSSVWIRIRIDRTTTRAFRIREEPMKLERGGMKLGGMDRIEGIRIVQRKSETSIFFLVRFWFTIFLPQYPILRKMCIRILIFYLILSSAERIFNLFFLMKIDFFYIVCVWNFYVFKFLCNLTLQDPTF